MWVYSLVILAKGISGKCVALFNLWSARKTKYDDQNCKYHIA